MPDGLDIVAPDFERDIFRQRSHSLQVESKVRSFLGTVSSAALQIQVICLDIICQLILLPNLLEVAPSMSSWAQSLRNALRRFPLQSQSQGQENVSGPVAEIRRIEVFEIPAADQSSSKLFTDLPSEIRGLIYEYVLADFEDMDKPYNLRTIYRRPEYFAPRTTDTSILRTCQAVYTEAWYLPWTSARHTFYLAKEDRTPLKVTTVSQMTDMLAMIEMLHPDTPSRRKEVHQIQVFAQAYQLEPGDSLGKILEIPHLLPKTVTITLRHTDMYWWENDLPLHLEPHFVSKVQFPASVTRVEIQFESLERRKDQVDYMVAQAANEWFFKRTDGVHLVARSEPVITRWTGFSSWPDSYGMIQRWIGDEDDDLPGKLRYYLVTLAFVPAQNDDEAGYKNRSDSGSTFSEIKVPQNMVRQARHTGQASLDVTMFAELGVDDSTPVSEVYRLLQEHRARSMQQRNRILARQAQLRRPYPAP